MKSFKFFTTIFVFIFVFLFGSSDALAAFSLNGTTIEQSGVDTDLSGLAAVSGVQVTQTGSGSNLFQTYYVGDNSLEISGELSIDPTKEQLLFGTSAPTNTVDILSGGFLNLGISKTINGYTYETPGTAIIVPRVMGACCSNGALTVRSGGTLDWNGATLQLASVMNWNAGSTVTIDNGVLVNTRGSLVRVRSYSTDLNVDGFSVYGGDSIDFFEAPVSFLGYQPQAGDRSTEAVSSQSGGTDSTYVFRDYNSAGLLQDFSVWRGADTHFINLEKTGDLDNRHNDGGATNQKGLTRVSKEFDLHIKDSSGSDVEGAYYYIRDTDNGSRLNRIPRSGVDYELDQDKIYTSVTDVDGDIATETVLTRVGYTNVTGSNVTNNIWDYRGTDNGTDDIFDIHIWSYEHAYSQITEKLQGAGVLDLDWTIFSDQNVTESDSTTVSSYGSIDNLDQLYDRAKLWKINNLDLEYPAIDAYLVTADGADLDLGDLDLIIDAAATQAMHVDETTDVLTINSDMVDEGALFTSFTTTGVVSFVNGAEQGTDYTDSTGFHPLDGTPPTVTIVSQEPSKKSANAITVDISVTDDRAVDLQDVQVSLANTTAGVTNYLCNQISPTQVDCQVDVVSSGDVEIIANDEQGQSEIQLDPDYIIDDVPPVITGAITTTGAFSLNNPEVVFSATDNIDDPEDISFSVSVDDGPFVAVTSPYTPSLVGDRHIIVVRASDLLGNYSDYSFVYTEMITITSPITQSNADINSTQVVVSSTNPISDVTISGAGSNFICTPDPTVTSPSSVPVTCTGVVTETGSLSVSATDSLITDTVGIDYVIESTPPVITITAPTTRNIDSITDTTIQITDETGIDNDEVFIDGSSSAAARLFDCFQTSSTQVDCTIDIASSGDLVILARDYSGNESTAMESYTVIPEEYSRNRGGTGSRSLLLCTTDPTALNYYDGDMERFRFYDIVENCLRNEVVNVTEVIEAVPAPSVTEKIYSEPECSIDYYRLIKRGIKGADVRQVQTCMNSLGYTSGPEDGIYGSLTYAGITAYQRAQGLRYVDGIVGPETSASLNSLGNININVL